MFFVHTLSIKVLILKETLVGLVIVVNKKNNVGDIPKTYPALSLSRLREELGKQGGNFLELFVSVFGVSMLI